MALDIEDPRTYLGIEPWPAETFQMLDDLDLERLCIDAGEELLRRYGGTSGEIGASDGGGSIEEPYG